MYIDRHTQTLLSNVGAIADDIEDGRHIHPVNAHYLRRICADYGAALAELHEVRNDFRRTDA